MEKGDTLLVVDDDALVLRAVTRQLRAAGYRVRGATGSAAALVLLADPAIRWALVELFLGEEATGLHLLAELRARRPDVRAAILTAYPSCASAFVSAELAAVAYLIRPASIAEIEAAFADRPRGSLAPTLPGRALPSLARQTYEYIASV